MKKNHIISVIFSSLLLFACSSDPLDVEISNTKMELGYLNLDSIIQHTPDNKLQETVIDLSSDFASVIDYELYYCLKIGGEKDTNFIANFHELKQNPYFIRLEKSISKQFKTVHNSHEKILTGFKYLKTHLPKEKMPKHVIYMNSYFASSAFCTETDIAIGLERYLGANNPVIKELPEDIFYGWVKKAMEPEYLERDAVTAWVLTHICVQKEEANTIEAIINWGKVLYLTEAAFPEMPKHQIVRYTEKDYDWAMKNERAFWDFLVKQKMLFSKGETEQANLLQEAPFTAGLPKKGPDRLGQFLGWRIIQSYMDQNDVTLQQLIKLPYTEILQEYEIND